MEKKVRSFCSTNFRLQEDSRWCEGYALKFEVRSRDMGGFVEIISRGALDGVLENSDIICVFQHNDEQIPMARYRGVNVIGDRSKPNSLILEVDEVGLKYRFEIPKSSEALFEAMQRGDIDESSFAFVVKKNDVIVQRSADGVLEKRINHFKRLYDVSPVSRAAYPTEVALRAEDDEVKEFIESEESEEHRAIIEAFEKRSWSIVQNLNGLTVGKSSREIKNGFIVSTEVYGYNEEKRWVYEYCEEYFATDPLNGEAPSEEKAKKAEEIQAYYDKIRNDLASILNVK